MVCALPRSYSHFGDIAECAAIFEIPWHAKILLILSAKSVGFLPLSMLEQAVPPPAKVRMAPPRCLTNLFANILERIKAALVASGFLRGFFLSPFPSGLCESTVKAKNKLDCVFLCP